MNDLPAHRSAWTGRSHDRTWFPQDSAAIERPAPRLARQFREATIGLIGGSVLGGFILLVLHLLH
jgi:hypothetical protein